MKQQKYVSPQAPQRLTGIAARNKVPALFSLAVMMTSTTTGKRSASFRAAMCPCSGGIRRIIPANRQVLKSRLGRKILGVRQQASGGKSGHRRQIADIR